MILNVKTICPSRLNKDIHSKVNFDFSKAQDSIFEAVIQEGITKYSEHTLQTK